MRKLCFGKGFSEIFNVNKEVKPESAYVIGLLLVLSKHIMHITAIILEARISASGEGWGMAVTYFFFIVDERCSFRAQAFDQTGKHCFSSLSTLQTEEIKPRANTLLILHLPIIHTASRLAQIYPGNETKHAGPGGSSQFELLKHGQQTLW